MGDTQQASYDEVLEQIADYVVDEGVATSEDALSAALLVFRDALACALLGAADPDCRELLPPMFASVARHPARVIGTPLNSTAVEAAFGTTTLIRWLDFNDTWLAREWGHPSDNLGGILAVADHLAAQAREGAKRTPPTMRHVLEGLVKAEEIQGVLALGTGLNRHGLDHVAFVRLATAAVTTRMLGGSREHVVTALAHAVADGAALRVYRHSPNVTWRKSWAAGDATARGVWLAALSLRGAAASPKPLSAERWGLHDAMLDGDRLVLPQGLGTHVVQNVLLKPWFPAEFHGQTAVEAAFSLRPSVIGRLDQVIRIEVRTHEAALRIIDKQGPLGGRADRDHCLQYMVAVALLKGRLTEHDYADKVANDAQVDRLRETFVVTEDPEYTSAYHDPDERAVANAVRVIFSDGTDTGWEEVRLPVGHRARRSEASTHVDAKLDRALGISLPATQAKEVARLLDQPERLLATPADQVIDLLVTS